MYIINILLNNTDILLNIFYITTVFCGISILIHKNAIISIIYFMLMYVSSSLYLYYIGFNSMPLLLILIYVGAIAILFLFILTLINVKEQEDELLRKYSNLSFFRTGGNNNSFIIFINIFIIFGVYIYEYCKEVVLGSQLYNIIDNMLYNIYNVSSSSFGEMLTTNNNEVNIYLNVASEALNYPLNNGACGEVVIIGQSMYTVYSLLLLILGIILILSIIAAIAILYTRNNCLVKVDSSINN